MQLKSPANEHVNDRSKSALCGRNNAFDWAVNSLYYIAFMLKTIPTPLGYLYLAEDSINF